MKAFTLWISPGFEMELANTSSKPVQNQFTTNKDSASG